MDEKPIPSPALGIPVAIVIGSAIIGAAIYLGRSPSPNVVREALVSSAPSPAIAGERTVVDIPFDADDPVAGNAAAPVTIVVFSEFQCPYCKTWHETVGRKLMEEYVDSGKARMVFKHFPLTQIHEQAEVVAIAAQCAASQGKFWQYADGAFASNPTLLEVDLVRVAGEKGLDMALFAQCRQEPAIREVVMADVRAGISIGVTATPTVIINGLLIEDVSSYDTLKQAVDAALAVAPSPQI